MPGRPVNTAAFAFTGSRSDQRCTVARQLGYTSFVKIRIIHCRVCWGYHKQALALAESLRGRFDASVEVAGGALGQFDVDVDGELIASRGQNLVERMNFVRFPDAEEVIVAIEHKLSFGEARGARVGRESKSREFSAADAKRFYNRFGPIQDVQLYEYAPIKRLIAHADFDHASSVFELGCGTGRLAAHLFQKHFPKATRYDGIDISATMAEIAKSRLAPWGGRVTVRQADGTTKLPYADATFDRFVSTYVLDLLPEAAINSVLEEAHRLLNREGKLCLATSTDGIGPISRLICSAWKRIYALNPLLVGGCRPLHVTEMLDPSVWRIEHRQTVSSWGICSEVVIAMPS